MHRFYLPPEELSGDRVVLRGREAHHAAHVVRLQPGENVEVLNGVGMLLRCHAMRLSRNEVELAVLERRNFPLPRCQTTLLQAIVKGKTMDTIIHKATELAVARIVPLQTERVVAHIDDDRAHDKQAKWQLTAVEAIKQCGSPFLPRIDPPITPAAFLTKRDHFDLSLVGSLAGDGRHPRHWFQSLAAKPRSAGVWIGPEGDFTPAELELIRNSGAKPITLGELVLRADTAAICSLAVIRHELEWLHATEPKP